MANQLNNNNKQTGKYQQGSGSEYHRLHASNVPDYGANSMDPIAESLMNRIDNNEQQ
ncbi:hypothetical protein RCG17_27880 [Neobacillus sp. PS3-12]|uniref:hypothetical protein n=1 Tax=Neobacillus sp. PS3-12 TaxID=3070677 RepID=UPI0027E09B3A|nr:hypothetical protein [Neobacillus sp. PS3-12]WML53107.1 hypothetical protein RCG17_27880 [Neobacillus sp. PS3-12]